MLDAHSTIEHIVFVMQRIFFSIGVVAAAFALSQHLAWAFTVVLSHIACGRDIGLLY